MLSRPGTLPAGCLPTKTDKVPSGGQWLHEIKQDGFRIIARKSGSRVRLYRPGNDFTYRFPLIVDALACAPAPASSMARRSPAMRMALPRSTSSVTTALTSASFLYAFDLIELGHQSENRQGTRPQSPLTLQVAADEVIE
jgi:bifunctional non-homologous end joining protein LigD